MDVIGDWIRVSGHSAEFRISPTRLEQNRVHVSGFALWGEGRTYGPNLGELDFSAHVEDGIIEYSKGEYKIKLIFSGDTLIVEEKNVWGTFGANVSFEGEYLRARAGAKFARWLRRLWPFG